MSENELQRIEVLAEVVSASSLVRDADIADKWPYSRYNKDLNRTLTRLMNT